MRNESIGSPEPGAAPQLERSVRDVLIRVMAVQLVSIIALWLLQLRYAQ